MTSPSTEVVIERLGHKGDGIASGPVFGPRSLPGERVRGALDGTRLRQTRIVEPSPERVAPPCPHYKSCGGCALQHVRDDFVQTWKVEVVTSALDAVGLAAPIRRVHTSPPHSRRRAVLGGRRTKSGAIIGFHGPESDVLVATPDCRVLRGEIVAAFPLLEAIVALGASRRGEMRLAVTETADGLDIATSGGHPLSFRLTEDLTALVENPQIARLVWDGEVVFQKTEPRVELSSSLVPFPPGGFLQATREGEGALAEAVSAALEPARGPVVDLFAGMGPFTFSVARHTEVHAVESDAAALGALDRGWRHGTGLRRVTTETRDLFRRPLLSDELGRFGGAVIDPPRAGAEAQIAELAASGLPNIAHVSCNPVTFARDAATLVASGYRIDWIDIVDQFRWSAHVELCAAFSLGKS